MIVYVNYPPNKICYIIYVFTCGWFVKIPYYIFDTTDDLILVATSCLTEEYVVLMNVSLIIQSLIHLFETNPKNFKN